MRKFRTFRDSALVIATHNKGKAAEIADLLRAHVPEFLTSGDLNLPEPEETGATFIENAALKARLAARLSGRPALADDSGMAVSALNGNPGLFSARWAGPDKDFAKAMERVHTEMGTHPDRSAAFICALSLAWPDGHAESFEGRLEGEITWPPRGGNGFGYDPIFVPRGDTRSFGEISPEEKRTMSHRAIAFRRLVEACFV